MFHKATAAGVDQSKMDNDFALARALQAQFDEEDAHEEVSNFIPEEFRLGSPGPPKKIRALDGPPETSIIAPEWEDLDPTPGKTKPPYTQHLL